MNRKILLTASCLLGLPLSSSGSLIAHYTFDEAAGASVASDALGGTPGAVGANVTTGVTGIAGNAYRFGGATSTQADIVDMGNADFFNAIYTSGQFSFSVWINTTDTTGNRNTVIFAGNDTASNVYADLGVAAGQTGAIGAASARNRPTGASLAQQTGIYSTPTVAPVNDGQWHHLVMTVDLVSSTLSLYVDGVLANTQVMTSDFLPTLNNFEIGRLGRSSPTDPYEGLVDDVQIYDHSLSLEEVQYLHSNPGKVADAMARPLVVTSSSMDQTSFSISFSGKPSTTYNVRGSSDLVTFDIDAGAAVTDGSGAGSTVIPLVPGAPRQFYRIEEVPAP